MKVVFADTGFWAARFDPKDDHHTSAKAAVAELGQFRTLTTEMVLTEFLTMFGAPVFRVQAAKWVRTIMANPNTEVVPQTSMQFAQALALYEQRTDKQWSLTDCASFELMQSRGVQDALAHDHHFEQAGFVALMRAYA